MRKGHTIIELLVAMGLLVAIMAASGAVFHEAVSAHRLASATMEISQKLQTITTQLDADFAGLRKDGEIVMIFSARPVRDKYGVIIDENTDGVADKYERFDRLIFFADGDFQSYNPQLDINGGRKLVSGNIARVSYMIGKDRFGNPAAVKNASERMLARNQHIYTADIELDPFPDLTDPDPANFDELDFRNNNYLLEYDTTTLQQWLNMDWTIKEKVLSIVCDATIDFDNDGVGSTLAIDLRGARLDKDDPSTIHMFFCDGLGSFSVQGWYDAEQRWVPEVDPDGDGDLSDTDFVPHDTDPKQLHETKGPGAIYPGWIGLNPAKGSIPFDFGAGGGFGRALKFTFTLYDSAGIFKDGKTFSYIVDLAD